MDTTPISFRLAQRNSMEEGKNVATNEKLSEGTSKTKRVNAHSHSKRERCRHGARQRGANGEDQDTIQNWISLQEGHLLRTVPNRVLLSSSRSLSLQWQRSIPLRNKDKKRSESLIFNSFIIGFMVVGSVGGLQMIRFFLLKYLKTIKRSQVEKLLCGGGRGVVSAASLKTLKSFWHKPKSTFLI